MTSNDKEVFRRTKYAWWSVRSETYKDIGVEAYASHHRCSKSRIGTSVRVRNNWSWFAGEDNQECFGCGCHVPDYIQVLVRLLMNK